MRYKRKTKQNRKNCGVQFHAEKNGMCTRKKIRKCKYTQNIQNYKIQECTGFCFV